MTNERVAGSGGIAHARCFALHAGPTLFFLASFCDAKVVRCFLERESWELRTPVSVLPSIRRAGAAARPVRRRPARAFVNIVD